MKTFRQFVADQVSRGESLPAMQGYLYTEAAQIEICDYFEARSGEKRDTEKQSALRWLEESTPARKVKAVMDEAMQGEQAPTIASIRATWEHLHGTHKPVNYDCSECGGSGFGHVVSPTGAEGAVRCSRGCSVPADRVQGAVRGPDADSEANSAWAELVGSEIAAKLAKPVVPVKQPPQLVNPLTAEDLEKAGKFDHAKGRL